MKLHCRIFLVCLIVGVSLFLSACRLINDVEELVEGEQATPFSPSPNAIPAERERIPRIVTIQVDQVIFEDIEEIRGSGEMSLHILAIRNQGNSAKLSYPTPGNSLIVQPGIPVELGSFALSVTDVRGDEPIYVYFLALDEDMSDSIIPGVSSDTAIDALVDGLTHVLARDGKLAAGGGLLPWVGGEVAGIFLDWWREADVLGIYHLVLYPSDNWYMDSSFNEMDQEGNMQIKFSIRGNNPQDNLKEEKLVFQATATPDNEPIDSTPIQLISPLPGSEYKNPIIFQWTGESGQPYQVTLIHVETGKTYYCGPTQELTCTFEIPKEEFGYWTWYVAGESSSVSAQGQFLFNPHQKN